MLILINQWLLNLIFSMKKALNDQHLSKKKFHSLFSTTQCYLENPTLVIAYFPLFSKLYKFLRPHSSCDCMDYERIKYNQFQINENQPDETYSVML